MNKFYKITFILYTLSVELICLLTLVFFGILADENVNFEKFYLSYFLGFELNYFFLNYFALALFVLTSILQTILFANFIVKYLDDKKIN